MRFLRTKSLLCLLMIAALLASSLCGCQLAQESSASSAPAETTEPVDSRRYTIPWESIPYTPPWDDMWCASPDDTYYDVNLQWAAEKIDLPDAWDIATGSGTIRVGVIDSGVDASHEDLKYRINEDLSESFVSGVSPLEDPLGHGTHVAGIIGAQADNAKGIAGVCWNVEIVSLRVSDNDNVPNLYAVINAIESADSKGIHILNISLGFNAEEYVEDEVFMARFRAAIMNFSGLIICAAGNNIYYSLYPALSNTDDYPSYPSCFLNTNGQDLDNLISVGASTNADEMFAASCFGLTSVDLFAPGTSILSCYPAELCCDDANCNAANHTDESCDATTHTTDGYHSLNGTSMAAPYVAGVAALLLSIHPELTPAELKHAILSSVDIVYDEDLNNVFDDLCVSGGRLNAYKALIHRSIHDFSPWASQDNTYHYRTCSTCGYTETGKHSDSWNSILGKCTVCGLSGSLENPFLHIQPSPDELAETTCADCGA